MWRDCEHQMKDPFIPQCIFEANKKLNLNLGWLKYVHNNNNNNRMGEKKILHITLVENTLFDVGSVKF